MSGNGPGSGSFWGIDGVADDDLAVKWTPRIAAATITAPAVDPGLVQLFPTLADHRSRYQRPRANYYWYTTVPHADVIWSSTLSGWHPGAQRVFGENWPAELDDEVDQLIQVYGSAWPSAFSANAHVWYPGFVAALDDLAKRGALRMDASRQQVNAVSIALREGPAIHTIDRRTWPFPTRAHCDVCGSEYYFDTLSSLDIARFGERGVCLPCCDLARNAQTPADPRRVDEYLGALHSLHERTQIIAAASFKQNLLVAGLERGQRQMVIAAAVALPDQASLRKAVGVGTWLEVLQRAGLVGEGWRPARGVYCIAEDGHPCRSLGEKAVCDWLQRKGIAHDVEPHWPADPDLNPHGRKRADWRIGKTFVEFAGMTNDAYQANLAEKIELARRHDIEVIVLVPEDLMLLDYRLRRFLKP